MGCCESGIAIENEVQINDKPMKESGFYDMNLDSPDDKGFDVEAIHSTKSTCQTSRLESNFNNTTYFTLA